MSDIVTLSWPREAVALVTMTNPAINNNTSWAAVDQLAAALTQAREAGAKVAVLASGVEGHWFEHAWLGDLKSVAAGGAPVSAPEADGRNWYVCLEELSKQNVVTIAAISGDTSGGGAELGWACDLRVAERQANFSQPEVLLELTTGIGGTSRLARLIGRTVAAEMVLEGRPMPAQRIYELGGLNRIVEQGEAIDTAVEWAARIAQRSGTALAALKRILAANDEQPLAEALITEQTEFQGVVSTPGAIARMEAVQQRFDAGESLADVYSEEP